MNRDVAEHDLLQGPLFRTRTPFVTFEFVTIEGESWAGHEGISLVASEPDVVVPVSPTNAWFMFTRADKLIGVLAFRLGSTTERDEATAVRRWLERSPLERIAVRIPFGRCRSVGCSVAPVRRFDDATLIQLLSDFPADERRPKNLTEWMAKLRHFRRYHLDEVMDMEAMTFRITEHAEPSDVLAIAD